MGARLPFRPGGFGLHGQIGYACIMAIDPRLEEDVFGDDGAPPLMLSMGLGVSF